MHMQSYFTPSEPQRFELELKRSRFLTSIGPVPNKTEAKDFIQKLRDEFPDANHHCWAMVAGRPDDVYQQDQNDDGEPKGTAGKPMLNVLQHSGLGNIVVVVTRYFGGIKLGAGGLVRAYTQSVSEALKELKTVEFLIRESVEIELPYSLLDSFEHAIKVSNIEITEKIFTANINLKLLVSENDRKLLDEIISSIGNGSISIRKNELCS